MPIYFLTLSTFRSGLDTDRTYEAVDLPSLEATHTPHSGSNKSDNTSTSTVRLPHHEWNNDGILRVNTKGPHPIFELMRRAESQWKTKTVRASKTLRQAVFEYKRRYNRPPPKGFDHW